MDQGFGQNEIDDLLKEAGLASGEKTPEGGDDAGDQSIDDILGQASAAATEGGGGGSSDFLSGGAPQMPESVEEPAPTAAFDASGATPASFESLDGGSAPSGTAADIEELLGDVELKVQVVLGRAKMSVDEILQLANGSVVELDKLAGDPLDILVNDRLVAKGEVLVLNENFCIRITDIIPPGERG